MTNLQFSGITGADLTRVVGCCGSLGGLVGPGSPWSNLLYAISDDTVSPEIAYAVTSAAIPEEGDPHLQRASVEAATGSVVEFLTPGGVTVEITPVYREGGNETVGDRYVLAIAFGRDSRHLTAEMLAQVVGTANLRASGDVGDVELVDVPATVLLALHLLDRAAPGFPLGVALDYLQESGVVA